MEIVPSASYVCHLWIVEEGTMRAAERLYVLDAAMLMCTIITATNCWRKVSILQSSRSYYTYEEANKRLKKRMEIGDAYAFFLMGGFYNEGAYGLPQDSAKAVEFWKKAGKFGYTNIGKAYYAPAGLHPISPYL